MNRRHFLTSASIAACSGLALVHTGCRRSPAKPDPDTTKPPTPPTPPSQLPALPAEFRGVWVASVANIDWPSAKGLPVSALRAEMLAILDRCVQLRLNAVLLQVRPSCDTIYPSTLEPWSEFLTGQSGSPPHADPPGPAFDPLAEWITHAHARGLELHAWFNPFRARHHKAQFPDAPSHISNTRPDLVRTWGDLKWLDPSEPDARAHSLAVILDVVNRYDVDGVHLDDYFYPYPRDAKPPTNSAPGSPAPGSLAPNSSVKTPPREEFPDDHQWQLFLQSGGSLSRSDWRRSHIDTFVRDLYRAVKSAKPDLLFGISPFGIWRPGHPPGIDGFDAHEGLFADARRWVREGWADYFAPQLYWAVDSPKQPFGPLLDWWRAENIAGKFIWPGLYTSRIEGEGKWQPAEIERQITLMRDRATLGHAHFSMAVFSQDRADSVGALTSTVYDQDALVPSLDREPDASASVSATATVDNSGAQPLIRLWWSANAPSPNGPGSIPRRWIVRARYAGSTRVLAFPPGHTGADLPPRDEAGSPLEMVSVFRVNQRRAASEPAVLRFTGPAAAPSAAPPRGS